MTETSDSNQRLTWDFTAISAYSVVFIMFFIFSYFLSESFLSLIVQPVPWSIACFTAGLITGLLIASVHYNMKIKKEHDNYFKDLFED